MVRYIYISILTHNPTEGNIFMQNRNIQHLDCEFNRNRPIARFLYQRIVYHSDAEDAEFHRESLRTSVFSAPLR